MRLTGSSQELSSTTVGSGTQLAPGERTTKFPMDRLQLLIWAGIALALAIIAAVLGVSLPAQVFGAWYYSLVVGFLTVFLCLLVITPRRRHTE